MSLAKYLAKAKAAGKNFAVEHPSISSGLGFGAGLAGADALYKAVKPKRKK